MKKPSLQFTSCECGKMYLVGINRKDIRNSPRSGGDYEGTPYIALDNPTIEKSPKLPEKVECKNCGKICEVKSSEAR